MDSSKVDLFLLSNEGVFPEPQMMSIRNRMQQCDEEKWFLVSTLQFKNPLLTLALSYLVGFLGVDRFYLGDTILGVLKLLTCGGCCIWWVIDLFFVSGSTKQKNLEKLYLYL